MTDLSIEDLKADQDAQAGGGDGGDGDDAFGRLIDHMIDRGYLDALAAKQLDMDPGEIAETDGGEPAAGAGAGAAEIGAEDVAQFGKLVIDQVGDVPMSTVVQYAEQNPQVVNGLIERATGGADDGPPQ